MEDDGERWEEKRTSAGELGTGWEGRFIIDTIAAIETEETTLLLATWVCGTTSSVLQALVVSSARLKL